MNNRAASGTVSPCRLAALAVVHPALKFTYVICGMSRRSTQKSVGIETTAVNLSAGLSFRSRNSSARQAARYSCGRNNKIKKPRIPLDFKFIAMNKKQKLVRKKKAKKAGKKIGNIRNR